MAQQTLEQFGQTIKQKYPQYNDLSDTDVANKVLAKYPQYKDMVSTAPTTDTSSQEKFGGPAWLGSKQMSAQEFTSQPAIKQYAQAFATTLPKSLYQTFIQAPLKGIASTVEAGATLLTGGKYTPNLGGSVSDSKKALTGGAQPFGMKAFVEPAVEGVFDVYMAGEAAKTVQGLASAYKAARLPAKALDQTMSSISGASKTEAGARTLTGSKLTGVKPVPTKYETDVAKTAESFIDNNIVKTENNLKQGIKDLSVKEILPGLESSSTNISKGVKTGLIKDLTDIDPIDITKADPAKGSAFNLFKQRVVSAVSNATTDKELFTIRQTLNDVADTQSGGKMWDETGKMNPIQEYWRQAYRQIGDLLKERNPQLADQLSTQSKLFDALEGVSEKTGKLIGKASQIGKMTKNIGKAAAVGAVGAVGAGGVYEAGKNIFK